MAAPWYIFSSEPCNCDRPAGQGSEGWGFPPWLWPLLLLVEYARNRTAAGLELKRISRACNRHGTGGRSRSKFRRWDRVGKHRLMPALEPEKWRGFLE